MTRYDHFHCQFEIDDDLHEIEGGWTGYPDNIDEMTEEEYKKWLYDLAVSWGMTEGAEIKHFWLAG